MRIWQEIERAIWWRGRAIFFPSPPTRSFPTTSLSAPGADNWWMAEGILTVFLSLDSCYLSLLRETMMRDDARGIRGGGSLASSSSVLNIKRRSAKRSVFKNRSRKKGNGPSTEKIADEFSRTSFVSSSRSLISWFCTRWNIWKNISIFYILVVQIKNIIYKLK